MTLRRFFFEIFNLFFLVVEWYFLFKLSMLVTGNTLWITILILGLLALWLILGLFMNRNGMYIEQENRTTNEYYKHLENQLQEYFNNNYHRKVEIIIGNIHINVPAVNSGNKILIQERMISNFQDNYGNYDLNTLWGLLAHELGHVESGISKGKLSLLRPSSLIVGLLRINLNVADTKGKNKSLFYIINSGLHFLFSMINLNFIFFRNDEIYANKFAINVDLGFYLFKTYLLDYDFKKPFHDLYHPQIKTMANKMKKSFLKYDEMEIYYAEEKDCLALSYNDKTISDLKKLANNNDKRALYEYGLILYFGAYGTEKNCDKGLEYIISAYKLGNELALRFLMRYHLELVEDEVSADLSDETIYADTLAKKPELLYYELYKNMDLSNEHNLNILIDGCMVGNYLASKYYIEYLLDEYKYPVKASEIFYKTTKSYSFIDFKTEEWNDALDMISWIENLDGDKVPKIEYLIEKLREDLKTENQHLWSYAVYNISIEHGNLKDIFLSAITTFVNDGLDFNELKKSFVKEEIESIALIN